MKKCPKCGSTHIIGVEYWYGSPERYDGVSEWECRVCGYRQGRWSGLEIPDGYAESRYGERRVVKISDVEDKGDGKDETEKDT